VTSLTQGTLLSEISFGHFEEPVKNWSAWERKEMKYQGKMKQDGKEGNLA